MKKVFIGIITFILYFVQSYFQTVPLELLGIDFNTLGLYTKVFYLLGYEFIFILILFLIYRKTYINDFKEYVKGFKKNVNDYFKYWSIAFGLMIVSNLIIVLTFPSSVATNQEAVNSIFKVAPIYIVISAILFAPFIEETIFRLSLRNIFKNDKLFIVLSGLIFGGLHVIGSYGNLVDLIYIIPYSIPGFVFAYTLVKTKNIFVPMGIHLFHNTFTIILQVVAMFLGSL